MIEETNELNPEAVEQVVRGRMLATIREIKTALGWKNKDIAAAIRANEQTVKNALAPSSKENLPKWVFAMVAIWNRR